MFVIKMRTLICYFAVFVICAVSIGVIRLGTSVPSSAEPTEKVEDGVQVPILMYHNIFRHSDRTEKYIVTEKAFEEDLKFLRDNGYSTVVMGDLVDFVDGKAELPEKCVVLSFDDGYFNNYKYAYPLLKEYGFRAVLSIIGYYTDLYSENPDENPAYSHVTWANVNEMIESGTVELQNHSYNLHSTAEGRDGSKKKRGESDEEYRNILTADLNRLQERFREQTGYTPTVYTYPFGSVSEASFGVIRDMGFRGSLSCESGMNMVTRDPECLYMMKRYLRTPDKSAADILK